MPASSSTSALRGPSRARPSRSASIRLAIVREGMSASRCKLRAAEADWQQPNTSKPAPRNARAVAESSVVLPAPAHPTTKACAPLSQATWRAAVRCCASETSTPSLARRSASSRSNSASTAERATRHEPFARPSATSALARASSSTVARVVKTWVSCSVWPMWTTDSQASSSESSARHSRADHRPMARSQIAASASWAVAHDWLAIKSSSRASRSIAKGSLSGPAARIRDTASGVMPSASAWAWKRLRSSGSGGSAFAPRVDSAAAWRAFAPPAERPPSRSLASISRLRVESASLCSGVTPAISK